MSDQTPPSVWFGIDPLVPPHTESTKICKQCGSRLPLSDYHKNRSRPGGYMDACKTCAADRSRKYYRNKRYNGKIRLKEFRRRDPNAEITAEYIEYLWDKQQGKCIYSGFQMTKDPGDKDVWSVDRVDSSKGYTLDNVVLCSRAVNMMKQDLPLDRFFEYVAAIYGKNNLFMKEEE